MASGSTGEVMVTIRRTAHDEEVRRRYAQLFLAGPGTVSERLDSFPCYVTRQIMARFLALYEVYKRVLHVHGDIIECGVFRGFGLFALAKFVAICEPNNFVRRIVGFDTFEGFPAINDKDKETSVATDLVTRGSYCADTYDHLADCIATYDMNRAVSHIPKLLLIKGDACETIPEYLRENPHSVVALLHLDFDLYEPTKVALRHFVPRMPKGAIILFDELNHPDWPGETIAVLEELGLRNLAIRRFPFQPQLSYARI